MSTGRRGQRLLRYGLVLFSVLSVLCVVATSATINGQPDLSPYPGWVTVLEPAEQNTKDRVGLMIFALDPGGRGESPRLVYSVSVCGPDRFRGVLLAGGQARLSKDPAETAEVPRSDPRSSAVSRLRLGSESSGNELALGAAQSLKLDFRHPPPCADEFKPERVLEFFGEAAQIVGRARAPVRRNWTGALGLWTGPREGSSWPLIGTLPGIPFGEVGVFDGIEGLSGKWKIPVPREYAVGAGTLNPTASVEVARPELSKEGELEWQQTTPFAATARVVNDSALANWEQAQIIATLLFGIGGSVLAAMALDATRGRSAQLQQQPQRLAGPGSDAAGSSAGSTSEFRTALPPPPKASAAPQSRGLLPVLLGAGAALVLHRLFGRRRG